eukprot:COSAG02_NODE_2919_length_7748_cov_39.701660_5_plen_79_part_00
MAAGGNRPPSSMCARYVAGESGIAIVALGKGWGVGPRPWMLVGRFFVSTASTVSKCIGSGLAERCHVLHQDGEKHMQV